ncbi:MAG: hypothetical protein JXA41_12910 [Deltaproteobacteria bacterium]|nr:hypothetical protein [Deltaproteobacteria bacterium]
MDTKEVEKVKAESGMRILCIGRIHKGRKTMILAFPRKGEKDHDTVSQSGEKEGEA